MSQQSKVPSFVRGAVRRAGLHREADALKYYLTRLRRYRANAAFRRAHADEAFPPPYMLYEAFNLDYEKYYVDGRDTACAFAKYVQPALGRDGDIFLDWGCGPARLLRHMPELLPAGTRIHGVDVNEETIAWCRRALPGLHFSVCGLFPPLGYSSGSVRAG